MKTLTRDERQQLCDHEDPDIKDFLTAVETGRIGILYDGGRGASRKPRGDATLVSYLGTLDAFCTHMDGTPWAAVTEADVEAFLHRSKANDEPRSLSTATQQISALRGFYKYLMAYERVPYHRPDENPTAFVRFDPARLRRPEERLPVSDAHWLAVVHSTRLGTDDRLAVGLGYYVGLRREEIVSVAPNAIDPLHKRILFVDRKGGKTKTGLEYGELVGLLCDQRPEVADGAQDWVGLMEFYARSRQGETTLVPGYEEVKHPGQRFRDQLEHHVLPEAGLAPDTFTPHSLRHSFGTNMAMCGLPIDRIADQMSHSSTETTERYINAAGQIAAFRKRQRVEGWGQAQGY